MEKKKGVIERVDLQGVNTYDDESFEPSLINFFTERTERVNQRWLNVLKMNTLIISSSIEIM